MNAAKLPKNMGKNAVANVSYRDQTLRVVGSILIVFLQTIIIIIG